MNQQSPQRALANSGERPVCSHDSLVASNLGDFSETIYRLETYADLGYVAAMRFGWILQLVGVFAGCLACGGTIAVTYSPGIAKRGSGPVRVGEVRYEPYAKGGGSVEANQVENTAIGAIYLTSDVGKLVRDALKMELHFMGYEYRQSSYRSIRGNVRKFMADDLGLTVDWIMEAEFGVETANSKLFSRSCMAKTTTDKGAGFVQGAITEIIRKCIDQFVTSAQAQGAL